MSSPASTSKPVRHRGKIIEWHATKAYGFADDGHRRIFIHIRDFTERHKSPEPGDVLLYSIGTDIRGRPCAQGIVHANDGGAVRPVHLIVLAVLLALPAMAIWRLSAPPIALWFAGWIIATSSVSYGFYAWDKRRAREGAWRLPEKMLHFWEALGGWPGGFIAQRRLRHKSSKRSFLLVFWFIVVAHNYAALDWQFDWRLTRGAVAQILSWLPDSPPPKSRVY